MDLRITGIGLNLLEITNYLGINPDYAYKKGDTYIDQKHGGKEIIYQEDCWIVGIENHHGESLAQTVDRFLDSLLQSAVYLNKLSKEFRVTIWISAYPENEQINLHLPKKNYPNCV